MYYSTECICLNTMLELLLQKVPIFAWLFSQSMIISAYIDFSAVNYTLHAFGVISFIDTALNYHYRTDYVVKPICIALSLFARSGNELIPNHLQEETIKKLASSAEHHKGDIEIFNSILESIGILISFDSPNSVKRKKILIESDLLNNLVEVMNTHANDAPSPNNSKFTSLCCWVIGSLSNCEGDWVVDSLVKNRVLDHVITAMKTYESDQSVLLHTSFALWHLLAKDKVKNILWNDGRKEEIISRVVQMLKTFGDDTEILAWGYGLLKKLREA